MILSSSSVRMKATLIAALVALSLTSLAQSERQIVAAVICAEARSEGHRGMQAVYEVICTRAREHKVSLKTEVSTRKWYSCLNRTSAASLTKSMSKTPQWGFAYRLAGSPPATKHSGGANHFTRSSESPSWSKGETPVAKIGNHSFYKLK